MKAQHLIITLAFLFSSVLAFAETNPKWEEELRNQLHTLLGNEYVQIGDFDVSTEKRSASAQASILGVKNVRLNVLFHDNNRLAELEAHFPKGEGPSLSDRHLRKLGGKRMQQLIPKELDRGLMLEQLGFRQNKDESGIEQLNLTFTTNQSWQLLDNKHFSLDQLRFYFEVLHPNHESNRQIAGELIGMSSLSNLPLLLKARLEEQKEAMVFTGNTTGIRLQKGLHQLAGSSLTNSLSIPDAMLDLQLDEVEVKLAPYKKWMALQGISNLGRVEAFVQKQQKKKEPYFYTVVIQPPADFKLSKLHSKLSSLDGISLANQKIVLSSEKKSKKESSKIPSLSQIKSGIQKGCQLVARIDLTKLRLEHLLKAKELVVSSPLTKHLDGVVLETALDTDLALGDNAKLKQVQFRIQPSPTDFAISLAGILFTQVGKDELEFKGAVELALSDQSLNFMALMNGLWRDPLGAKGLSMEDVGIQMGASFLTAPAILPNVALTGNIALGDFRGSGTIAFDTRNPTKSMLAVGFNEIQYAALVRGLMHPNVVRKIPRKTMETLEKISMSDVEMEVVPQPLVVLDKRYDPGFKAAGAINVIGLKGSADVDIDYENGIYAGGAVDPLDLGFFKLKGADGNAKPGLIIDLRKNKSPKVAINGLVSLLGLQAQTDVEVLPNGFRFKIGGKVFHLFDSDIQASGSNLERAGDMQLRVSMKNDLLNFIDQNATRLITEKTEGAIQKLTTAQKKLTNAQTKVKEINKLIKYQRKEVKKEQAEKRKKYDAAKRKVKAAEKKVNSLNKEINRLKRQAKSKNKPWQLHERAWIEGKIKTVQATKGTAILGLKAAQLALDGFKGLNKNPDLHPKMVSLYGSREVALKTMDGCKLVLEGLKKTLGIGGKAANFVIEKGADLLINIREANFNGQLGTMSGGVVDLSTKLEWMGKNQQIRFKFDFNNTVKSVGNLVEELLKRES